jgi:metallo-beta-lactamase class B
LYAQNATPKLEITPLTGDFYIYTTYNAYQDIMLPAHGMYVVTDSGVVLFDTPWDTTQFQPLLDTIASRYHKDVITCIATHWHSDRTEGLEYYKDKGIATYTTALTDSLSAANNKKRAEHIIYKDTIFHIAQYAFEIYYPGPGHTTDNIVIWFEKEKILYGGCLIKGADAKNLGNLADANVEAYATTLENVRRKYADPKYIIVSHSDWSNNRSLKHSIKLAKRLKRKE